MEESLNEIEAQCSFRSPPRRRRSTFFDRRESFVPQKTENVDPNECETNMEVQNDVTEDLLRYHNQLLAEKDQWKREVNDRRHKYHDLRENYLMSAKHPSTPEMFYSALTNEDIRFLEGKFNIRKLVDSQCKFHKSLEFTKSLVGRVNEFDDLLIEHWKSKVNKITECILENSAVEPIE